MGICSALAVSIFSCPTELVRAGGQTRDIEIACAVQIPYAGFGFPSSPCCSEYNPFPQFRLGAGERIFISISKADQFKFPSAQVPPKTTERFRASSGSSEGDPDTNPLEDHETLKILQWGKKRTDLWVTRLENPLDGSRMAACAARIRRSLPCKKMRRVFR